LASHLAGLNQKRHWSARFFSLFIEALVHNGISLVAFSVNNSEMEIRKVRWLRAAVSCSRFIHVPEVVNKAVDMNSYSKSETCL
jgi:hypothetical protein